MAKKKAQAPVVLVDGSSYLFRAYYALPDLSTSSGQPTGAVRGVIAMIRKLAKDYPGSMVVVVFDAPGKTFRDDMYDQYKANRESMPDDLRQQIQPIHEIIRAMGLPLLVVPDVEADDVIGTLAQQATHNFSDASAYTHIDLIKYQRWCFGDLSRYHLNGQTYS